MNEPGKRQSKFRISVKSNGCRIRSFGRAGLRAEGRVRIKGGGGMGRLGFGGKRNVYEER